MVVTWATRYAERTCNAGLGLRSRTVLRSGISYRLGALRMSTELGVNAPDSDLPSPMYDVMTVGEPTRTATADILHVEGQVKSSATVEYVIKEL